MTQKKRGLGTNLEHLLSPSFSQAAVAEKQSSQREANESAGQGFLQMPISQLQPGEFQPRRNMTESTLLELSQSIQEQGILQPILVRKVAGDKYEIIAGERRWRAARLASLTEVPVVIHQLNDKAALAVALIENIQRESLSVIEEAIALQRLQSEFAMTHQQIAASVGKSRTTITNLLRLLNLQQAVQDHLEAGDLDMGHARALLTLDAINQLKVCQRVVAEKLSVRQTELLIRQMRAPVEEKNSSMKEKDPDVLRLQNKLADKLSARVDIQYQDSGKGKLVIHYNTLDELEGIITHIE